MFSQFYFLSPVEVVKVTVANLEQVADWCGGKIAETESRRVKGRMDKYVWVPTPKGSTISWAFPGMYITKRLVVTTKGELKATWSVFRRDYFEKNYFNEPIAAVDATWEREAKEKKERPVSRNIFQQNQLKPEEPTTAMIEEFDDQVAAKSLEGLTKPEIAAEVEAGNVSVNAAREADGLPPVVEVDMVVNGVHLDKPSLGATDEAILADRERKAAKQSR